MVTEEQDSYSEAIYEMPYDNLHGIERHRVDRIIEVRTKEKNNVK